MRDRVGIRLHIPLDPFKVVDLELHLLGEQPFQFAYSFLGAFLRSDDAVFRLLNIAVVQCKEEQNNRDFQDFHYQYSKNPVHAHPVKHDEKYGNVDSDIGNQAKQRRPESLQKNGSVLFFTRIHQYFPSLNELGGSDVYFLKSLLK